MIHLAKWQSVWNLPDTNSQQSANLFSYLMFHDVPGVNLINMHMKERQNVTLTTSLAINDVWVPPLFLLIVL